MIKGIKINDKLRLRFPFPLSLRFPFPFPLSLKLKLRLLYMKKQIIVILVLLFSVVGVRAQGDVYERSKVYEWPTDKQVVDKLKAWQDLKFGVLMHWGIYSVPGIVESWSIVDEDWITRDTTQTFQQYQDW